MIVCASRCVPRLLTECRDECQESACGVPGTGRGKRALAGLVESPPRFGRGFRAGAMISEDINLIQWSSNLKTGRSDSEYFDFDFDSTTLSNSMTWTCR